MMRGTGRETSNGTYHFHTAINTTCYELVFLDIGPVYTVHLTRMLTPGPDGESLDHLSTYSQRRSGERLG